MAELENVLEGEDDIRYSRSCWSGRTHVGDDYVVVVERHVSTVAPRFTV